MEKERVKIADIAEELGLSTATVSNVIHGKTKKVSGETIKRVHGHSHCPGIPGGEISCQMC